jgi:hypothetical protein
MSKWGYPNGREKKVYSTVFIHVQYIILYIIWKYNEENFNDIIIVSQYLSEKMIVIQYFFVA